MAETTPNAPAPAGEPQPQTPNLPAPRRASEVLADCPIGPRGTELSTFAHVHSYAAMIVAAGLAPKGMETIEKCVIAIELGLSVGMHPLQSVQNIAPINGRPTIWGDAAKAIVMNTKEVESFREWFDGEGDNLKAVCEIRRRGYADPVVAEFSIADARKADLLNKQGPWKQYPRRMLQMRARSWAMRDSFPDALKGLYCREELDYIDVSAEVVEHLQPETGPRRELREAYPQSRAARRAPRKGADVPVDVQPYEGYNGEAVTEAEQHQAEEDAAAPAPEEEGAPEGETPEDEAPWGEDDAPAPEPEPEPDPEPQPAPAPRNPEPPARGERRGAPKPGRTLF